MKLPVAAVVLLLPALAAGQAPTPLASSAGAEAEAHLPEEVDQGAVAEVHGAVRFSVTAFCPHAATARAELRFATAAEGVQFDPPNLTAEAPVPAGAHGLAGQPPHEAEAPFVVRLLVGAMAAPGEHAATLTATSLPVEGCPPGGAGDAPPTERVTELTVTVRARAPAAPVDHPEHEEHGAVAFDFFLEPGATREVQFNVTGTFPYHDHFRAELRGTVVVAEQGPERAEVRVTAQGYEPAEVQVRRAGSVHWTNADTVPHTVSVDEQHDDEAGAGDAPAPSPPPPAEPPRSTPGAGLAGMALAAAGAALRAARRRGPR